MSSNFNLSPRPLCPQLPRQLHQPVQLRVGALVLVPAAVVAGKHQLAKLLQSLVLLAGGLKVIDPLGLGEDVQRPLTEPERTHFGCVGVEALGGEVCSWNFQESAENNLFFSECFETAQILLKRKNIILSFLLLLLQCWISI